MKRALLGLLVLGWVVSMLPGCAAALVGAGVVGGYAVAKDMEDGQLIDNAPKKKENKGWFSGGDD